MKINELLAKPVFKKIPVFTYEILLFTLIILAAVITRFYDLGARPMSHDESLHTYYSYKYATEGTYTHNPMMHGPFQFHLLALTYFFLGANDFTARIPAVLFSITTIVLLWYWRRYIGKIGTLIAALMFVISPYMLFYGRYVRNEAFVGVFAILTLYATLRYLESGAPKFLYILTASLVLHLTTKETAYIYTAELLIFLAAYFIMRMLNQRWEKTGYYQGFIIALGLGILSAGGALGGALYDIKLGIVFSPLLVILGIIGLAAIGVAIGLLFVGIGWERIRTERSFDLLVLTATLILPTLSGIFTKLSGGNPLDYTPDGLMRSAWAIIPLVIISTAIGLFWNANIWLNSAMIFWGIFIPLYTSLFSNGQGFFSGLIGSLAYWLEQHPVQRGSQPLYYYVLVQLPIYEYLAVISTGLAAYFGLTRKTQPQPASPRLESDTIEENYPNTFSLLLFWAIASLLAFTFAGERMPWLTFHIALPMLLLGGWGIGQLVEKIEWQGVPRNRWLLSSTLMTIAVLNLGVMIYLLLGNTPPFSGKDIAQLLATRKFLLALVTTIASTGGVYYLLRNWKITEILKLALLTGLGFAALLTTRTAFTASYINESTGKEFLVYAHGNQNIKDALAQIAEISYLTTGANLATIAYDDDVAWPLTWYMKDYPNARYYGSNPDNSLKNAHVILVGDNNYAAIEPIMRNDFYQVDYIRMVWPNMDYYNLNWKRIWNALSDRNIRQGLLEIWLNRDYEAYANGIEPYALQENQYFTKNAYTIKSWSPADRMRLYIRKDVAAQIWQNGIPGNISEIAPDPYEKGKISIAAEFIIGTTGALPGQFQSPRQIAFAPDGSYYVADSRNHRIQHLSAGGQVLNVFGSYAASTLEAAPPGSFNEPWGVVVGRDGSVFVADTWNHRIQKFTAQGEFVTSWGYFGNASQPDTFYGPRQLAIDAQGRIYVADTGNNRISIFDSNGKLLGQFGSNGIEKGQFSEPTGVAVDSNGLIYVADTWNQRIQVFAPNADLTRFDQLREWKVEGWYGQSLENKPFLTVDPDGNVFASDPELYRILVFNGGDGSFIRTWGAYGTDASAFGLPASAAIDQEGYIWVSDAGNNRIMRFRLP